MKAAHFVLFLFFGAQFAIGNAHRAQDKTITKVVKLLEKMLDKSKKEADDDKNAYGKFKCYADKSEAEKTESIRKLSEQISLLESKIAELQATNGELSLQSSDLNAKMTENKVAQKSATGIRESSEKAFKAMEEDLLTGIGQMKEALDVLNSIALQQTKTTAFQDKFMAASKTGKKKTTLLSLGTRVQNALNAVSALLPAGSENQKYLKSFLQAPLSAVHTAQGDAIVGILKNLKSTFEGNLKNAQDSEKAEKKAFDDSIATLKDSYEKMDKSLKGKQQALGDNDGELASKKTSHEAAVKQKGEDEDFLAKLQKSAAEKAKEYDERKMLRANEDAAIAECISILNSDAAFATFGTVSATSTGKTSFLQVRRRFELARQQVELVLERAAVEGHSDRLSQLAKRLHAGNPFTTVLAEIEKMKTNIVAEAAADKENKEWCEKENKNSNTDLDGKKSQIKSLNEAIDKVDSTINDPKTGLKQMIKEKEASLLQNQASQVEQTATRKKENAAYQEDVSNLAQAEDILGKAIAVLKRYYDELAKSSKSLVQVHGKEDPTPPKTFDAYDGQSKSGGEAISMLEFILGETKKEHSTADTDEKKSQKDFDESMDQLKQDEVATGKSLVKMRDDLAENEKTLLEKKDDLKDTTEAKESIENYLTKIKPGCDFIAANYDLREKNRDTETKALTKAVTLIKDTPAYKSAAAKK